MKQIGESISQLRKSQKIDKIDVSGFVLYVHWLNQRWGAGEFNRSELVFHIQTVPFPILETLSALDYVMTSINF